MNADEADDFACLLDADFLASLSSDIDVSSVRAHFQIDTSQDARVPEPTRAVPHESPPTPTQPAPMGVDNYLQITGHSQKWTIGKIIAESEKATVREAVGHDGRVAAVKILPLSHRDNDRVDQEAAIGGLLSTHPNILDVYDYIKTEEAGYIFMERAQGDLYEIVENATSGLDEDTARTWFRTLVVAVAHCHQNGYSHRDLKPENCLISNQQLKLSDFGSAVSMSACEPPSACGTVQYAAPERFSELVAVPGQERQIDVDAAAVDLWSLGIMLYVLVKQQFPFMEPSMRCSRFRRFVNGTDDSLLDGMSDSLKELIRGILQQIPADRLGLEKILNHPWLLEGSDSDDATERASSALACTASSSGQSCAREAGCFSSQNTSMLHSTRTLSVH